jgi:hypothetical protein
MRVPHPPGPHHVELARGCFGQVDDLPIAGAAIIDAHDHRVQVAIDASDLHVGAEGQDRMRGRELRRVVALAAGGSVPGEVR